MIKSSNQALESIMIRLLAVLHRALAGMPLKTPKPELAQIHCDAETVVETETGIRFLSDSTYFDYGQNRSEDLHVLVSRQNFSRFRI